MDDLKKVWNELKSDSNDFTTILKEELMEAIHLKSKGPIGKLQKQVRIKWYFSIFLP
jgi:hypothetical protein